MQKALRIVAALLAVAVLVSTCSALMTTTQTIHSYGIISRLPWLSLDGQWIVNEEGNRVALRGAGCDYTGYKKWDIVFDPAIEQIADRGYNYVRLAFNVPGYYTHNVEYDPDYMDYAIDLCEQNGLYVIFTCMHWWAAMDTHGWEQPLPDHEQEWIDNWVEIATRYKDRSAVFAYELYNEPLGAGQTPDGKNQADTYIDCMNAIREVDTKHPFIVYENSEQLYKILETEAGISDRTLWTPETARSDTIYATHMWWGETKGDPEGTVTDFAGAYRLAAEYVESLRYYSEWMGDVPVWAGEFGTYVYDHPDYSHANWEYVREVIRLCEDAGIFWNVWQMEAFNQYAPEALEHITPIPYTNSDYPEDVPRPFDPRPYNILDYVVDKSDYTLVVGQNRWGPGWIGLNNAAFWVDLEGPISVRVKVWDGSNPYGTLVTDEIVTILEGEQARFTGSNYTEIYAEEDLAT